MDYPESLAGQVAPARVQERRSARAARRLTWSLWGLAVAQAAFGLFLAVLNELPPRRFVA